jgi:hypothetical protein
MPKILLFIFAIQPILSCLYVSLMVLNSYKITEGLSYLCLVAVSLHYLTIGLKEVFKN